MNKLVSTAICIVMLFTIGCNHSIESLPRQSPVKVRYYAYKCSNNKARIYLEVKNFSNDSIFIPFILDNSTCTNAYTVQGKKNVDLTNKFNNETIDYFDFLANDHVFDRTKRNRLNKTLSDSIIKVIVKLYPKDDLNEIIKYLKKIGISMRSFTETVQMEGSYSILLLPPHGGYTIYNTIRNEFIPDNGLFLNFTYPSKKRNWSKLDSLVITKMKFPLNFMGYKLHQEPIISKPFLFKKGQIPEPDMCDPASPDYNVNICDSIAWSSKPRK